ncbi:MAG: LLM class flavin-dependent oxidoreductase [Candidatus Dormibacteraeota bacterium]|nr:LLM class flavin-dependent oxidoreductase [Candidatus Dormibacteraeota bacterium]
MRYGFVVPAADAAEFADLAALGEEHGWDAVFTWESVYGVDAWVTLGAAAMRTRRIRLGTLLTPASRIRPWDLASRVGTVDRLSGGRVILSVGLGALNENWLAFEPDEGRRTRAQKLDESLAIFAALCAGGPVTFEGRHYSAHLPAEVTPAAPPPTVQRPHPPVWVVGLRVPDRSRQRSLERAARWEGLLPAGVDAQGMWQTLTPATLREIAGEVSRLRAAEGRSGEPYDVVVEGDTYGGFIQRQESPRDFEEAGATWWIESWWDLPRDARGQAEVRRRVEVGPAR